MMQPLAHPNTTHGQPRRCGVEVEFAGLTEHEVAAIVRRELGGKQAQNGHKSVTITQTAIGDITVELDTALRKYAGQALVDTALDLSRAVVPMELITAPLDLDGMARLAALCQSLRHHGAIGSHGGVLLGFGVHLNPEITGRDDPFTFATIQSYGLLEAYLRQQEQLDVTRRLLPFIEAWPPDLVDALIAAPLERMESLTSVYLSHVTSRNHGLDLLPLLCQFDADQVARTLPDGAATSARPCFHFRLPDCRIDEAGWSLARPWAMWRLVEAVAADAATLALLKSAWAARPAWPRTEAGWADQVAECLPDRMREIF